MVKRFKAKINHIIQKHFAPEPKPFVSRVKEYIYLESSTFEWLHRRYSNVRQYFKSTKKIIQYVPILWNDRDWDFNYIFILLKYKLSRVRECIDGNEIIAGHSRVAKQVRYAEFLIDRILNDEYFKKEEEAFDKKWGDICRRKKWTDGTSVGHAFGIRQNATTQAKYQQQQLEHRNLTLKQAAERQKDLDRLFRHLRLYIERWWD